MSTDELGKPNAGNLQTKLNLIEDNDGLGNVIIITEGTDLTQPTVCVTLKLTCQLDFANLTVNGGDPVDPYLETVLTAKVPSSYSIKKAFVPRPDKRGRRPWVPVVQHTTTSCIGPPTSCPVPTSR